MCLCLMPMCRTVYHQFKETVNCSSFFLGRQMLFYTLTSEMCACLDLCCARRMIMFLRVVKTLLATGCEH